MIESILAIQCGLSVLDTKMDTFVSIFENPSYVDLMIPGLTFVNNLGFLRRLALKYLFTMLPKATKLITMFEAYNFFSKREVREDL